MLISHNWLWSTLSVYNQKKNRLAYVLTNSKLPLQTPLFADLDVHFLNLSRPKHIFGLWKIHLNVAIVTEWQISTLDRSKFTMSQTDKMFNVACVSFFPCSRRAAKDSRDHLISKDWQLLCSVMNALFTHLLNFVLVTPFSLIWHWHADIFFFEILQ